jgi:hypothetical protein
MKLHYMIYRLLSSASLSQEENKKGTVDDPVAVFERLQKKGNIMSPTIPINKKSERLNLSLFFSQAVLQRRQRLF